MHLNEFYKGILQETKITKSAANTFQIGNAKPSPQTQSLTSNFNSNYSNFKPYINSAQQSIKNIPTAQLPNTNFRNTASQAIQGQLNKSIAPHWYNSIPTAGPLMGMYNTGSQAKNMWEMNKDYNAFNKLPPEQQGVAINSISSQHPEIADFLKSQINRYVPVKINSENGSQLWNQASSFLQGKDNNTLEGIMMRDPNIKALATGSMVGRAGTLSLDWLKNNWKTLAGVVGIPALMALVYSLFKGNNNNQRPAAMPQQTGPQSL